LKKLRPAIELALVLAWLALLWLHPHSTQLAYVGPGAGFAFLGSLLSLIAGFFLSVLALLAWPFRMAWQTLRRRRGYRHARVKRAIFLGLDGLDPRVTERLMDAGKLPNLARLRAEGSYTRLRTTFPALSPVAWSTFATGVSPAKHNIFDFLDRSLKSYLPQLSSARVGQPRRVLRVGRWRIPLSRPSIELLRKSQPFWKILGAQGITCAILRVPITFPPEKFDGRMLSAMCTPDLKGTQGSFSQFSTRIEAATYENGSRYPLRREAHGFAGEIEGPADTFVADAPLLRIPFHVMPRNGTFELHVQGQCCGLVPGEYTGWQRLKFRTAIGVCAAGLVRFLATETGPEFSLYMTPINIDPERPALPISHPPFYAAYLANLLGPYATVGMAEDTWALNEGAIDEDAFLRQAWDIFAEREGMFLDAIENTPRGVVACVFDTSDRIQHMFYRRTGTADPHAGAIDEMYQRMDALVGKAMAAANEGTALFVLSDHGFCAFRRGVNINSWLRDNGYLHLKNGEVDWSRTRAYALGLGGFYLNMKGREALGIVEARDAAPLKAEIIARLGAVRDTDGSAPIRNVYATESLYRGPYLDAAPDFIVGYNDGYRCSWEAAVGKVSAQVIEDNPKAWSGDHCVDPALVPGVLFSNRKIAASDPGIEDLAPTALALFGVPRPAWMEGKPLV
jgi:predicted AlkP superfamily phosphohydrolase/phosphomutase